MGGNVLSGGSASGMAPDPTAGFTPGRALMERARNNGMFGGAAPAQLGAAQGFVAPAGASSPGVISRSTPSFGGFNAEWAASPQGQAMSNNLAQREAVARVAQTAPPAGISRGAFEGVREAGGFGGAPQAGIQTLGAGADPNTGLTGMRALFERLRNRGQFG